MEVTPAIVDSRVVTRCGASVLAVDLETGELEWRVEVSNDELEEDVFVASDGVVLAAASEHEGAPAVASLDPADGSVVWRRELPGRVMSRGLAITNAHVIALTFDDNEGGYSIVQLNSKSGKEKWRKDVAVGANNLVPYGKRIFFSSAAVWEEDAGLWVLEGESGSPKRLLPEAIPQLVAAEDAVVALIETEGGYEIAAIAADKLEPAWRKPAGDGVAGEGAHVAHFTEKGRQNAVALRKAADGEEVWTADAAPPESGVLTFLGSHISVHDRVGLVLLDREDGSVADEIEGGDNGFSSSPAAGYGRLVIGSEDQLVCFGPNGA